MARYSLVRRFIIGAILWSATLLIIGAILLSWIYRQAVYRGFDDTLEGTTSVLIAFIETSKAGDILKAGLPIDARYQTAFSGHYWVIASIEKSNTIRNLSNSRSLYEGTLSVPPKVIRELASQPGLIRRFGGSGPFKESLRIVAQSVLLPNRSEPVIVMAAADRHLVDKTIQRFSIAAAWTLAAFAIGLIFVVVLQVRLGLSPLFRLRQAIADIRNGAADRVLGQYPIEIEPLAGEMNSLIDHNKSIVERARTHVGNLAHALKTPLSVLTNEVHQHQNTEQSLAEIVEKQTHLMARQVDHHLHKARAAARATGIGAKTNIPHTINELLRTVKKIYQHRELVLSYDDEGNCFFRGEKQDLEEIIGNLLDNACKWAENKVIIHCHCIELPVSGGKLQYLKSKEYKLKETQNILTTEKELGLEKLNQKGQRKSIHSPYSVNTMPFVKISVEDNGTGLAEEHLDTVLKRGERLDEQQSGSGLGLSIVDDLSRDYGGYLSLQPSSLGGLKVIVFLPAIF